MSQERADLNTRRACEHLGLKPPRSVAEDRLRDALHNVSRFLSQHGQWTDEGYFFRGLADPEMGEMAKAIEEVLR